MAIVKQLATRFGSFGQGFLNGINNAFRLERRKSKELYNNVKARAFTISAVDHQLTKIDKKLFKSNTEDKLCKWCNKPWNIKCRYANTQRQHGEEEEMYFDSDQGIYYY